jgi:hypothetical protein
MSESRMAKATGRVIRARYGQTFWDEVERELESFDASDFAQFVAAGRLRIEPRPLRDAAGAPGIAVRARQTEPPRLPFRR